MPLIETIGSASIKGYGSGSTVTLSGHVTSGLVLDWDFSNPLSYSGTGNTINDLSGSGRTGTRTAQTAFTSDEYGGGFYFTGPTPNNTWIDFPAGTYIAQGTNSFTLESWHDSEPGGAVLLNNYPGSDGSNTFWFFYDGYYLGNSDAYFNPREQGAGRHHLIVSRSGNTFKVYLDGVLKITNTNTRSIPASQWRLGSDYTSSGGSGEGFKGKIWISRAYNRALSDAEVAQNFNTYRTRFKI